MKRDGAKRYFVFLLFSISAVHAATYSFPSDLTNSPFNCTGSGNSYSCDDQNFENGDTLSINSDITITIKNNFEAGENFTIVTNSYTLDLILDGDFTAGDDFSASATVNITAKNKVELGDNISLIGTIVSDAGAVTAGAGAKVTVQIYTVNNDVITLGANANIASVCVVNGTTLPMPPACNTPLAINCNDINPEGDDYWEYNTTVGTFKLIEP